MLSSRRNLVRLALLIGAVAILGGCAAAIVRVGAGAGAAALAGRAAMGTGSSGLAATARAGAGAGPAIGSSVRGSIGANSAAAISGVTGLEVALTKPEISFLRTVGVNPASAAAGEFVLGRALTESHLTSLLIQREGAYLARTPTGSRVYASIRDGHNVEAGWLRKVDQRTVVFNDGTRDLLLTQRDGNLLSHFSVRGGGTHPLSQTRLLDGGKRFQYWTWSPTHGRFVYTGYGLQVPGHPGALRVYSPEHRLAGTLLTESIRLAAPGSLPRATIVAALAIGAAAVPSLEAQFEQAPPTNPDALSCDQSSNPWSRARANDPEVVTCRRVIQLLLADDGERLQFSVTPVEGAVAGRTPSRSKDPMFYIRPKS